MDIPLFQQQHSTLDHSGIIFHNLVITLAQLGDHNETNLDWEHSIGCFGIPLSCGQHIYWPYYLHKKCLFSPVHTNHIFLSTMHALLAKDVYLWAFCPPSGIEPLICVPPLHWMCQVKKAPASQTRQISSTNMKKGEWVAINRNYFWKMFSM